MDTTNLVERRAAMKEFYFLNKLIATYRNYSGLTSNDQLPNPDLILTKTGIKFETLKAMEYDPHIAAVLQTRESGVKSLQWSINRGTEETVKSEFIEKIFERLDIQQIINDCSKTGRYGFQPLEIIWNLDNENYIVPTSIIARPPEWFEFNEQQELCFLREGESEVVPLRKFLIPKHNPSYTNPYGESLLTKCYWSWTFKKGAVKLWMRYCEKFGIPYIYANKFEYASPDVDIDAQVNEMLLNIQQDGSGILPSGYQLNTIAPSTISGGNNIFLDAINFFQSEISKAILSNTLTTEQSPQGGSNALGNVHFSVLSNVINADKRMIEDVFNKLIKYVLDMNFTNNTAYPYFELYQESDVDLIRSQRDAALCATGQIEFTQEYIDTNYCEVAGELKVVKPQQQTSGFFAEKLNRDLLANQSQIDKRIDNAEKVTNSVFNEIYELIENAGDSTVNELKLALLNIMPNINTDGLENLIFNTNMVGTVSGIEEVVNTEMKGKL